MATLEIRNHRVALASGMVAGQANCTDAEAVVKMDEYAQARTQTLEAVAAQVVRREIRFSDPT